jgi:hypothetical protein
LAWASEGHDKQRGIGVSNALYEQLVTVAAEPVTYANHAQAFDSLRQLIRSNLGDTGLSPEQKDPPITRSSQLQKPNREVAAVEVLRESLAAHPSGQTETNAIIHHESAAVE